MLFGSDPKKKLRKQSKALLERITFNDRIEKSNRIQSQFEAKFYRKFQHLFKNSYALCFSPVSEEPRLQLEYMGQKTAYVRVTNWSERAMVACEASREIPGLWEEVELAKGVKLNQPTQACREVSFEEIGFVLVPGLAFDSNGDRLGRGVGFYDRYLQRIPHVLKIGVCFDEQIVESIPTDSFDQKVDAILTDQRWVETPSFEQILKLKQS